MYSILSGDKLEFVRRFLQPSKVLLAAALAGAVVAAGGAQNELGIQSSESAGAGTSSKSDPSLIEIVPGIPLPPYGTAWILDSTENKSRLVRLRPSGAVANKHAGENLARAEFMVLKDVSTLDLFGASAGLRISSHTPAIFIRKSDSELQQPQSAIAATAAASHYVLVRMRAVENRRVLCSFSYWKLGGKRTRHEEGVEASTEEIAGGRWLKLTPKQPLADGEYAVVSMPEDKTQAGTSAYDFGVGAPARPQANR